jgi:hypothetical protein
VHQSSVDVGTKKILRSDATKMFHCEEPECAQVKGWSIPREIQKHYSLNHSALAKQEPTTTREAAKDLDAAAVALPRMRPRGHGTQLPMTDGASPGGGPDPDSDSGSNYGGANMTGSILKRAQFFRSRTAIESSALSPVGLVVDRGVVICSRCNFGVQRRNIPTHIITTHPDLRSLLPPQTVIDTALDELGVPAALDEKMRPAMVEVPPLPSIPVTLGWRCISPGCVQVTGVRSSLAQHFSRTHRGIATNTLARESHVQMVYTSPKLFWAVNLDTALLVDDQPLRLAAVEEALQLLDGVDGDGTVHTPASDHHMTPFLLDAGWAALCAGKNVKRLINMGQRTLSDADDSPIFSRVSTLVKQYFSVVMREVKNFDYKAGCWINTPEGCV